MEVLACCACKSKLMEKEDGSGLKCTSCKLVYPLRNGIPVMMEHEARVEE